jgi:hypothetical protein
MRPRALGLAGALTAVVGLGAACEPPMEVTLNVSRDIVRVADESPGQTGPTLLFHGEVYCTRPEPIDLWISLRQNQEINGQTVTVEEQAGEHTVECDGPEGNDWALPYTYTKGFDDGTTAIAWRACTNPGDTIDEDCITVQRPFAEIRSK